MVTNLKEQFGRVYTVVDDGTGETDPKEKIWCMQINGKHGFIYPYGWDGTLAVCFTSNRVAKRALQLGLAPHQRGDYETVLLFPPSYLHQVAKLIKAQKRKQISPELRADLMQRLNKANAARGQTKLKPKLSAQEISSGHKDAFLNRL